MSLQICRESFVGNLPDGSMRHFEKGASILDPGKPEEAKLLKLWGKFFAPVASTHAYAEKPKPAPKPRKARAKKAAPKPAAEPAPELEPEPTPEPELPGGLSNARLRESEEEI